MPFDPNTKLTPADHLASMPKIERGIPLRKLGPPNLINRDEFYSAVQVGESFLAPDRAFANHCVRWGRYNERRFAKRIEGTGYRVWRLA